MSVASEARRGHHISKTRDRDGCELPCGAREYTQASRRAAESPLQALWRQLLMLSETWPSEECHKPPREHASTEEAPAAQSPLS